MLAMAAVNDTCSSRSRIRGGLISEGTSTTDGPLPPWSRKAAPRTRAISGLGAARSRRGAASYARRPASAAAASSGFRVETSRTRSRNKGKGRGARDEARPCCSALCSGSRDMAQECGSEVMAKSTGKVTIKRYANRQLYRHQSSSYITLDRLAQMYARGVNLRSSMQKQAMTSPARCSHRSSWMKKRAAQPCCL